MRFFISTLFIFTLISCGVVSKPTSQTSQPMAAEVDAPVIPIWPDFSSQGSFNVHLDTHTSTRDGKPFLIIGYIGKLCGYPWRYTIGLVQPGRPVKTFQTGPVGRGACGAGVSVSELKEGPIGLYYHDDATGQYDSDYGRNFNFILRIPKK